MATILGIVSDQRSTVCKCYEEGVGMELQLKVHSYGMCTAPSNMVITFISYIE